MKKMLKSAGLVCPHLSRKFTYLMLLLVSLIGGTGSAWADEVTFNASSPSDAVNLSKMAKNASITSGVITISNTTKDGWQTSSDHANTYKLAESSNDVAGTLTVSCSNGKITSVVLNYENGSNVMKSADHGNLGTASNNIHTWTSNEGESSVKFTGDTDHAVYITSIVVTYTADAPAPTEYTITYELFGKGSSSGLTTQSAVVPSGESLTDAYYNFAGWYTDKSLTKSVNVGDALTATTTLYAKWTKKDAIVAISESTSCYFNTDPSNTTNFDWYGAIQDVSNAHTNATAANSNCSNCLKFDSKGSLNFDLAEAANVDLYFADEQNNKTISIDGSSQTIGENGKLSLNLAAGIHTIKKQSDEVYLFYVDVKFEAPTPATHSITYNLNGGSGTTPTQEDVAEGETFTVASGDGITKSGYTFNGWNDGTNNYAAGATYTMGTSNVTLTAQWQTNAATGGVEDLVEINTDYKFIPTEALAKNTLYEGNKLLTFSNGNNYSNGLQIKENRAIAFKVAAGAVIKVKARNGSSSTRTIQLGTALNSDHYTDIASLAVASGNTETLTKKYDAGGIVYLTANNDLYMTELEIIFSSGCKVTYHHNGHGLEDNEVKEGQYNLPNPFPIPVEADGYSFVGWYTDENCNTPATPGVDLTSDMDLYAKWSINKGYTIPLNGNGLTTTLDHLVEPQRGLGVTLPTAYQTSSNIAIPNDIEANWNFHGAKNKGPYDTFREAYFEAGVAAGDVLTQQVTGLENGRYEVVLDVAASATNIRNFKTNPLPTGSNLTQAFAGESTQFIPVIDRTRIYTSSDYDRVVLVATVTDGTLTYGIKNAQASGNWYLCRVQSIKKIDDGDFTGWNTKADGTGTAYAAGATLSPNFNGTVLYAQWKQTYNFRPVAKNGTISSVTVNGETVAAENNVDIKVAENATVVMTVAAESGYKFKNWSVTGTTGEESNNGLTYTINAINADTKAIVNFVALSTATDPNPTNGALNDGVYIINPFPASYAGKTQSIDLGLPAGATFTVTSDNASNVDGKLSVVAPNAQQSTDVTIQVTAEDGTTTKTYTIRVSTVEGESYSYTVNAVDGSTVLKEIASGDYAQGTGSLTVYYPQHVLVGSKLYELSNGTNENGWYRKIFAPDANDYKVNIGKSTIVDNVVYFTEAEELSGFTPISLPTRASMGMTARSGGKYTHACTLKKGTYKIVVRGDGDNHNRVARFKANNDEVFTFNFSQVNSTGNKTIKITEDDTEIYVACEGSNAAGIDWFYIQDLGVLPVGEDGQVEYLSETDWKERSYYTGNVSNWSSKTFDGIVDKFLDMKTNRKISLKVKDATAFEVFTSGTNSEVRTYTVKVGNGDAKTYNCTSASLNSSGIIATNSLDEVVIEIEGGSSSTVYPVKVKFYTSHMIIGAESTVTMGKPAVEETLQTTSGTLKMVTPSAQAAALVTASFNSSTNELTLTPVKAGVAHLTFNIVETVDEEEVILNTVDYVVNVVKQKVTITYLSNGKDTYNAKTDGAFQSPTAVVTDEDGATINDLTLLYISDDESLVKFNGTVAEITPNVIGSAKLKAVLYNHDVYENAVATYTVNVSAGIDKKLYEWGVDSKGKAIKKGLAVPNPNDKLVAEQGGKVLMTMTYGGYKYNGNKYTNEKGTIVTDSWKGDSGNDTEFKAYDGQGSDIYGNAFDNQIDDFGFQTQAQHDSRDEYNRGIQWYSTDDVKTDGTTHYTKNERIKPFSLPVKGAYLKFEAEVNGTLTAYVLQNGNINFSGDKDKKDQPQEPDANHKTLATTPRVYYWFNQDGYRIDPTSFTSKQPLTIGRDYNENVANEYNKWVENDELKRLFEEEGGWPTQAEVDANKLKPVPSPQPVVRYNHGYMIAQKAYVKYVIPVVAGDTYYFFSNGSKVGAAGFNFQPAEDGTVDLILPEDGGSRATIPGRTVTENDSKKALNCTTDVATTHKTSTSIDMYKEVTLPRKFKVNTWSTICLPFHVTETQVERVFGTGTDLIVFNGVTGSTARFQKHVNQDILAGQPYLIWPTGEGIDEATDGFIGGTSTEVTGLTFTNVNFTPNVAVQSYASNNDGPLNDNKSDASAGYGTLAPSYIFTGTLSQADVKKYDYYVNNNTGELTRYTGNGTKLNAYYAYLKNAAENPTSAKAISGVSFLNVTDDDYDAPTGIMDVLINEMNMEIKPVDGVYNLSGQKISDSTKNLPKGIYIINGQKVNIK